MSNPMPPQKPKTETPDNLRNRLIRAIFVISESSPTGTRSIIDSYARHISPSKKDDADSNLPYTIRRHPIDRLRTQNFSKVAVMLSLVGIAIVTYYEMLNNVKDAASRLESLIELLERVGKHTLAEFDVTGSDPVGYTLTERAPAPAPKE